MLNKGVLIIANKDLSIKPIGDEAY